MCSTPWRSQSESEKTTTAAAQLATEAYHNLADLYLETLVEELEDGPLAELKGSDVDYSVGPAPPCSHLSS